MELKDLSKDSKKERKLSSSSGSGSSTVARVVLHYVPFAAARGHVAVAAAALKRASILDM
jgi:hypothetical protein